MVIRREIEVKRKGLPVVIDVTYGTDLIQMEFKVTDCIIPVESSAVAYSQGRTAEVHKQICTIDENVISFTPEKGYFEEGRNELQLRVVHNNRSLFTFKCRVECQGSFADSDAEEVKSNSSLVEQLMTEQAVTKARLEEVLKLPEDGSDVEKALNDIKVGANGKVYPSPGEAVRQQIGQVSEQIDVIDERTFCRISNNMIDMSTASERGEWWYRGVKYGYNDGNDNTKRALSFKVKVKPNTTYYTSTVEVNTKIPSSASLYHNLFNRNDECISCGSGTSIITTTEDSEYVIMTYVAYDSIDSNEIAYLPWFSDKRLTEVNYDEYEELTSEYIVKELKKIDGLEKNVDNNSKQILEIDKEMFNISEYPIYKGSESYLYTTSTFSGWISDFVADEDMKITKFIIPIKARANGVSRVRCYYGKGSFSTDLATIVEDVTIDIKPNTQEMVEFGSYVEIKTGENFFVGYACDNFCDMVSVADNEHSYGGSCYTTNGAFPSPSYFIDKSYDVTVKHSVYCKVKESKFEKSSGKHNNIKLVLPDKIDLVVGETFELFYKGILNAIYPENYDFEFSFSNTIFNAKNYKRKLLWTPNEVGTVKTIVTVRNDNGDVVDKQTLNFQIHDVPTSPTTKKVVLCVGDSLTTNGDWVREFYRRLTATDGTPNGYGLSNIQFIGVKGTNGAKYVGEGGWQFSMYNAKSESTDIQWVTTNHTKTSADQHSIYADSDGTQWKLETIESGKIKLIRTSGTAHTLTSGTLTWVSGGSEHSNIVYTSSEMAAGNPFWNESTGKVDFANFATSQGVDSIDHCEVLLGWNDTSTPYETYKSQVCTFLDNVLSAFPNCKITLLGLQVPSRDGFGENYGVRWNYYEKLQAVWKIQRLYEEVCKDEKYVNNVKFTQVSSQFDTDYNHLKEERAVNTRNTTTEIIQTNGVHPALSGQLQIADVATRNFVARL